MIKDHNIRPSRFYRYTFLAVTSVAAVAFGCGSEGQMDEEEGPVGESAEALLSIVRNYVGRRCLARSYEDGVSRTVSLPYVFDNKKLFSCDARHKSCRAIGTSWYFTCNEGVSLAHSGCSCVDSCAAANNKAKPCACFSGFSCGRDPGVACYCKYPL
jgi:hypothetical protein